MTLNLDITTTDGRTERVVEADNMGELLKKLTCWTLPCHADRIVVSDEGVEILAVAAGLDFSPPVCDPLVAETLARLTAQSLIRKARSENVPMAWEQLLPGDPLITLAAEVLGSERLVLLRRCLPGSRALPGDWAPAVLLRAVVGALDVESFAALVSRDSSGSARDAVRSVLDRLPAVNDGLHELDEIQWGLGERVRLLLVARGWLQALDAA